MPLTKARNLDVELPKNCSVAYFLTEPERARACKFADDQYKAVWINAEDYEALRLSLTASEKRRHDIYTRLLEAGLEPADFDASQEVVSAGGHLRGAACD